MAANQHKAFFVVVAHFAYPLFTPCSFLPKALDWRFKKYHKDPPLVASVAFFFFFLKSVRRQ